MTKLQCPNCGGQNVRNSELNIGCLSVYFLGGLILTGVGLSVMGMAEDTGVPNVLLWAGIVDLVVGLLYFIGHRNYARIHRKCLICGNEWPISKSS